jgi:hypothetical protein
MVDDGGQDYQPSKPAQNAAAEVEGTHDERLAELNRLVGLELHLDTLLCRGQLLLEPLELVDTKACENNQVSVLVTRAGAT